MCQYLLCKSNIGIYLIEDRGQEKRNWWWKHRERSSQQSNQSRQGFDPCLCSSHAAVEEWRIECLSLGQDEQLEHEWEEIWEQWHQYHYRHAVNLRVLDFRWPGYFVYGMSFVFAIRDDLCFVFAIRDDLCFVSLFQISYFHIFLSFSYRWDLLSSKSVTNFLMVYKNFDIFLERGIKHLRAIFCTSELLSERAWD